MTLEPSFNQPEIDLSMKEESIPKEDNDSIKEKELGSKDNELMIKEDNEDNERNKLLDRDDIVSSEEHKKIDLKEIEMNIEKEEIVKNLKGKIDSIKTSQYISKDTKDVNSIKTYHRKHSKDIIENTNEHIIDEIDTDQQLLNLSKIDKEVDIKDTIKDIPLNGEVSRSFLNEITNRKEKEQQFNNTVIVDKHLHSNIQSLTDIDDNTSLLSIVPFGEDRKDISSTTFQSKMDELSLNDNTFFNTNQNIDENDTSLLSIVPFGNNRLPPSDISTTIPTNTILTTTIPTNTQNLSSSIEKVHSNNIQNEHEQPIQNENEQQSIQNENEQQSIQNEQTSLLSIVPFGENRISTTDISKFETNHQTIDESNTINKPMDEIPFQPFQNINSSEISIHDKQILNDSKEISIHNDKQTLNDLEEKQPFISTQTINNSTSKISQIPKTLNHINSTRINQENEEWNCIETIKEIQLNEHEPCISFCEIKQIKHQISLPSKQSFHFLNNYQKYSIDYPSIPKRVATPPLTYMETVPFHNDFNHLDSLNDSYINIKNLTKHPSLTCIVPIKDQTNWNAYLNPSQSSQSSDPHYSYSLLSRLFLVDEDTFIDSFMDYVEDRKQFKVVY